MAVHDMTMHDVCVHVKCIHDMSMHDVAVHDVAVHDKGVPGLGIHKNLNFSAIKKLIFNGHFGEKTPIFSYYMLVNSFLQI